MEADPKDVTYANLLTSLAQVEKITGRKILTEAQRAEVDAQKAVIPTKHELRKTLTDAQKKHELIRLTPTPEDAIDFWRVMMARYGVTLLDLNLPADRHTVYNGLNKMGMGSDALKYYALTFGTRMYLPFEIGTPVEDWTLWEQIKCCMHEHFHVGQQRQYEGKEFALIYESNATARAYFEAEAYRTDMVLEWRYQEQALDPKALAAKLYAYRCDERDVKMVEKMLRLSQISIAKGAIPGTMTQFACAWLDARWDRTLTIDWVEPL